MRGTARGEGRGGGSRRGVTAPGITLGVTMGDSRGCPREKVGGVPGPEAMGPDSSQAAVSPPQGDTPPPKPHWGFQGIQGRSWRQPERPAVLPAWALNPSLQELCPCWGQGTQRKEQFPEADAAAAAADTSAGSGQPLAALHGEVAGIFQLELKGLPRCLFKICQK